MLAFDKILETSLYVDDLATARNFYGEKLGLTEHSHVENRYVFYRLAEGMLLVFNADATRSQANEVDGNLIPPHGAIGAGHMAFTLPENSVEDCLDLLRSNQIDIESVVRWPAGGTSIYVRDPAGNCIEFATQSLWF